MKKNLTKQTTNFYNNVVFFALGLKFGVYTLVHTYYQQVVYCPMKVISFDLTLTCNETGDRHSGGFYLLQKTCCALQEVKYTYIHALLDKIQKFTKVFLYTKTSKLTIRLISCYFRKVLRRWFSFS